ncbi:MAG: hypothetical protein SVU32_05345 [Candidatus Nanohaloarchaea archaeon]|nr:hypothetical protein [Candidatus Nanohaloarchaea archaeon]
MKLYDIYYVPANPTYGSNAEYTNRVDKYHGELLARTPFQDCTGIVKKHVYTNPNNIDNHYDLLVILTNQDIQNAYSIAGTRNIVIYDGLPENDPDALAPDTIVFPHEVGHEFELCDEYSKSDWNQQDNMFGCGNPWPGDSGWHPIYQCTQLNDGSSPDGTCGKDLDGDPATKVTSYMGGGGGFQLDADGNIVGSIVNMPRLSDTAYQAFKQEINSRGFQCP